jgi:hypothetical protein
MYSHYDTQHGLSVIENILLSAKDGYRIAVFKYMVNVKVH